MLFSSRRQNFHENPCFIRSTKLVVNRRFHGFKAKSFLDSIPSASNTGKNKTAAFPFKFEAKTTSTGSVSKGNNFYDEVVFRTILKTLKWLKVPAVVILLLFVSMYGRDPALAARSGGAMGGSSFSSSSSSSPKSSSSSSSSRSSSSRSGSGSSSSSYRSSSGSSSGSGSGSSSSSYRSSSGSSSGSSRSGGVGMHICGSSFEKSINRIAETADTSTSSDLIYILQETTKALSNHSASWLAVNSSVKVNESMEEAEEYFKKLSIDEREKYDKETLINLDNVKSDSISDQKDNKMSRDRDTYMVVTILVAAKGKAALNFPNKIASKEDLKEAFKELQIISKSAEVLVKVSESIEDAERYFRRLSIEEQEKFDRLTLVNVDNIKSESLRDQKANTMSRNTHMVVTILVAAKGRTVLKFPSTIDSNEDLKKALKELQTISNSAEIQAVNVLWSPQDGNEVMSCEELYEEYPLLCRIGGGDNY
ncbi:hypothetical protein EZV62_009914 [Acer yangbiense]|uniref:Uncharacterized protein n=1 Tax=Acer yangbiense TaxID=1000413 RepID=A0A5C7I198_9ROSI|nr:hypothetical protein EZV62_009914 [Acer yangbiense]